MAVIIQGGIGSGYRAKVDNNNRLWVQTEGISVGSLSVNVGSETYIKGGSVTVYNMVAGSIVYMPSVSVTAGSESYIKGGSISVYNRVAGSIVDWPGYNGSKFYQGDIYGVSGTIDVSNLYAGSLFYQGDRFGVSGNVSVSGTKLSDLAGSFAVTNFNAIGSSRIISNRVAGSIVDMPIVGVSGTLFQNVLGSVQVNAGSVAITNLVNPGSVYVTNFSSVGSFTGITGGSEVYIKAGSIQTYSPLGSTFIMGSVYAVGSVWFGGIGSVVVSNMPAVGSFTGMGNGSMWFGGGVGSVTISGITQIAGSIWSMPSVSVNAGSNVYVVEQLPTDANKLNAAIQIIMSGNVIGSLIKFYPVGGSSVKVLSYTGAYLSNVGSWV
jgi:hypothetical protein